MADIKLNVSKPVNKDLIRIFTQLDLIEQTGLDVFMVTQKYGKESFKFMEHFINVTIPFAYKPSSGTNQPENLMI